MNTYSSSIHKRFDFVWWMLKLTYGLVFVVAGADKFINLVTDWEQYVGPVVLKMIPLQSTQIVYAAGILEIILGLLILTTMTRIGAYAVAGWLLVIVLNLLSMGTYFDIAVRDVVMSVAAIALAQLTIIKDELHKESTKTTVQSGQKSFYSENQ